MKKILLLLFLLSFSFYVSGLQVQCNDAIDNDGDGLIDGDDSDCSSPLDDDEGCTLNESEPNDNYLSANSGATIDCTILKIKGSLDRDADFVKLNGGANENGVFDHKRDLRFEFKRGSPTILHALKLNEPYGYFQFFINPPQRGSTQSFLQLRPQNFSVDSRTGYLVFFSEDSESSFDYEFDVITVGKKPKPKQIVYVKFRPGFDLENISQEYFTFNDEQFKSLVFDKIKNYFASYGYSSDLIEFTQTEPHGRNYSTITITELPFEVVGDYTNERLDCSTGRDFALSEFVDVVNYYPQGEAVVCVQRFGSLSFDELVTTTSKVSAHEIGHLLGLVHVYDLHPENFLPVKDDLMHNGGPPQFENQYVFSTSYLEPAVQLGNYTNPFFVQKADDILKSLNTQDT